MLEFVYLRLFSHQAGFSIFQRTHQATPWSQEHGSVDGLLTNNSENNEKYQTNQDLKNNTFKTKNNNRKNGKRKIRRGKGNKKESELCIMSTNAAQLK